MYTFDSRIRYSETDPDGYLRVDSLIDYLQDCSTFQSEDLGIGISYLQEHHCAWLINYWQIDILRLPRLGERVVIGTSPYEIRGFLGKRNFMMESKEGERLVNANSIWSLIDTQKGLPVHATKEMIEPYEIAPKFDMEYLPRKIQVPKEGGTPWKSFFVTEQDIDSNHHVNNSRYVRMAMVKEKNNVGIRRLRVDYLQQAHLGDSMNPVLYGDMEGDHIISLNGEDGKPVAIVEIIRSNQKEQ